MGPSHKISKYKCVLLLLLHAMNFELHYQIWKKTAAKITQTFIRPNAHLLLYSLKVHELTLDHVTAQLLHTNVLSAYL